MIPDEDRDFAELRAYCEGAPEERRTAARRLDERALREGQISQEAFDREWGNGA